MKGLAIGSTQLEFTPQKPRSGNYLFDTGTAGSTTLVLQSLLPLMAYTPDTTTAEVRGGTNNPWAPPLEYTQQVLLPTLNKMRLQATVNLKKRGFYPRGGGAVQAQTKPLKKLEPITLTEMGEIRRVYGTAYSSKLPAHIVERMTKSAAKTLTDAGIAAEITPETLWPPDERCALSPGCGIVFTAETTTGAILGSDSLGEIGKPAEKVGEEAAATLLRQIEAKAPVDPHLEDQLIPYMALADGDSEIRVREVTPHATSCIYVAHAITGAEFEVKEGHPLSSIKCRGTGLENALR